MVSWKGLKKIVPTGHSEIQDGNDSRFSLETYKRLPADKQEQYKRDWVEALSNSKIEHDNGIDTNKLWPLSIRRVVSNTNDIRDGTESLSLEFDFINTSIFDRFFNKIKPQYVKELNLRDFVGETRRLIENNIVFGNHVIISRVLETNAKKAFGTITVKLQEAQNKHKNPLVELFLSPINSLGTIALKESERLASLISVGLPKEILLNKNSGISTVSYLTHLRHLWLYMGTITFAYALSSKYSVTGNTMFMFHFRDALPSARDTFVLRRRASEKHDPDKQSFDIIDTYFIEIEEYGIGLDGVFYKFIGKSEFDWELLKETRRNEQASIYKSDFSALYEEAEKIEANLLLNSKLNDALKAELRRHDFPYIERDNCRIPSIMNVWKLCFQNISAGSSGDILTILDEIGSMQEKIELYLAGVRTILEQ